MQLQPTPNALQIVMRDCLSESVPKIFLACDESYERTKAIFKEIYGNAKPAELITTNDLKGMIKKVEIETLRRLYVNPDAMGVSAINDKPESLQTFQKTMRSETKKIITILDNHRAFRSAFSSHLAHPVKTVSFKIGEINYEYDCQTFMDERFNGFYFQKSVSEKPCFDIKEVLEATYKKELESIEYEAFEPLEASYHFFPFIDAYIRHGTVPSWSDVLEATFKHKMFHRIQFMASLAENLGMTDFVNRFMPETITIFFKFAKTEKIGSVNVYPQATIWLVKQLVQDKWEIPPSRQRFIFAGRVLADGNTLNDYEIRDSHSLHLLEALRGD